ncbi:MAG: uracil phosphoribosyltransferase [Holosporales bacterium]|jgi:uracil phosphoribosyltransferase|nr:uracil phosphoribosyltransferase [Holosporales bacterium]
MEIHNIKHPLIEQKVTELRDKNTKSPDFRKLVDDIVTLLTYEATRSIIVDKKAVDTPLTKFDGVRIAEPYPVIIPILRAGLGMLDGIERLLPEAEIGFLGMKRDEETLEAYTYANRLPRILKGRQCFLLDPMLATGHTLVAAVEYLVERGAKDIVSVNILAAPEGIKCVEDSISPDVSLKVFTAAIDSHLNEKGYIVPGLGDAGDRLYGVVG